jgi:hypothetical protein
MVATGALDPCRLLSADHDVLGDPWILTERGTLQGEGPLAARAREMGPDVRLKADASYVAPSVRRVVRASHPEDVASGVGASHPTNVASGFSRT